jgi:hypothetical protein
MVMVVGIGAPAGASRNSVLRRVDLLYNRHATFLNLKGAGFILVCCLVTSCDLIVSGAFF